jgi:chromosome segregation ATPase
MAMFFEGAPMSRTLNPQLFGPIDTPVVKVDAGHQQVTKRMRDLEAQVEVVNQKMDRWAQIVDGRIQQLTQSQKNIVEQIKAVTDGFNRQMANLHSKINERRSSDVKTQELFERHNQLVLNFEARLNQIQKLSTEQEMKLMTYQATYDEILREIRNLRHPGAGLHK